VLVDTLQKHCPGHKEDDERDDTHAAGAEQRRCQAEEERPGNASELAGDVKEAVELGRTRPGGHRAKEGAAERLAPTLYEADHAGQYPEVPGLGHEVAEYADQRIDAESKQNRPLGAEPLCQGAEEEGHRHSDDLGEEQRSCQVRGANADLRAIDGGHLDNGADAIRVQPEGDEEPEQLAVATQIPKGLGKALKGGTHGRGMFTRHTVSARLRHQAKERYRKQYPPDRHAQKGGPHRGVRVGKAKPVRLQEPQQVDGEQDAPAQVAKCVALG